MSNRNAATHLSVFALLLALTACGGEPDAEQTGQAGGTAATPPAQTTGQEPATPPPGGAPTTTAALPAGVTQEMVQQGREVFHGPANCYTCHGQNGTGSQLAPALNDQDWLWIQQDEDVHQQIVTLIRTGISQPKEYPAPMPPMGGASLSEEQLNAVSAYVYSISMGNS